MIISQILTVAAISAPWWSLSSLWNSLSALQWAAAISALVLTVGAVIEYWSKLKLLMLLVGKWVFRKSSAFDRCVLKKLLIHSAGPLLVVLGIAGDFVFEGRAFILEDRQEEQARQIVGSVGEKAKQADAEAKTAITDSSIAVSQAKDAILKSGEAEASLGKAETEAKNAKAASSNALTTATAAHKEERETAPVPGGNPQYPDARHRVCRDGRPHPLGASFLCAWDQDTKPLEYCRAHDSVHEHDDFLAPPADPAVGYFLSPPMLQIVGILLLFLGDQLLHRGIWRRCPSASLAIAWTGRGDHGCLDVWNFRECAVRHCDAVDRKRGPVVGGSPILTESEDSAGQLAAPGRTPFRVGKSLAQLTLKKGCLQGQLVRQ
jgi:hypothetical protein